MTKLFSKKFHKKFSRRGFTLIELSILIIVLTVIITGLVSVTTSKISNEKVRAGSTSFTTIYQALGKFLLTNRRLPCPASLIQSEISSSSYATEISATNCVAAGVYTSTVNSNLVYGMVPAVTLGLPIKAAEDAYGSKIIYVVDKRLTTTSADSFELNVGNSSLISITGGASLSNALFVLISRGPNKSGAFIANSTALPIASSDSNELSNDASSITENTPPTASTSTFDSTFVQSASSTNFDDIIFYKTQDQMFNEFDAWSLIPCVASSETLYGVTVNWPKAYAGQIIASSTSCPSPNWLGSVAIPAKKCGTKGVWGSVTNPCTCTSGYSGVNCT